MVREWREEDIEQRVAAKGTVADRIVIRHRRERPVRRRPRDPGEQRVLDHLCLREWRRALELGKVKFLSSREWYYECD